MRAVVVSLPPPLVTPGDVPGSHAADDPRIAALIQVATEEIDGPDGWVGRAFGPQTLRATGPAFPGCGSLIWLPCPPVIEILSVKYLTPSGAELALPVGAWQLVERHGLRLAEGPAWPLVAHTDDAVRVEYQAGYDGKTTGDVPERVRQAIILAVQELKLLVSDTLLLRSETVEGIGSKQFSLPDAASRAIRVTVDRLLMPLRIYT